jgi:predicted nucleic acid-binding protein
MSDRFFLDTNVLVYSFIHTEPAKAKRATTLIDEALDTGRGVISYQVAQEFLHVATRKFAAPMTAAEAEQYLMTVLRPLIAVQSSIALYSEALRLIGRHSFGWYDALVVASAEAAGCSLLYSEDLQDGFRLRGLTIRNPFPKR